MMFGQRSHDMPPGVVWLAATFFLQAVCYDISGGRVHLDVDTAYNGF